MRLFVLLAVILRYLVRGKYLYLRPLAFEGGRKLKIPIPGLKNTLNRKLIILLWCDRSAGAFSRRLWCAAIFKCSLTFMKCFAAQTF